MRRAEDSKSCTCEPMTGSGVIWGDAVHVTLVCIGDAARFEDAALDGSDSTVAEARALSAFAMKSSTSLCRHLCPHKWRTPVLMRLRALHVLMRSSDPRSLATNQWLALSISVPQMSHEIAWRITESPPTHFIADFGKRRRIEEKESLFVSKRRDGRGPVSKWDGPTLSTRMPKGWALDFEVRTRCYSFGAK